MSAAVPKAPGTTRRSPMAMGTLRRHCGGMGLRTHRAIHVASIGADGKSTGSGLLTSTPSTVKPSGRRTLARHRKTFLNPPSAWILAQRATHYERVLVRCSGLKPSASFRFTCCCRWRPLAVDGDPRTSQGHDWRTPVMRRPGARRRGPVVPGTSSLSGKLTDWLHLHQIQAGTRAGLSASDRERPWQTLRPGT